MEEIKIFCSKKLIPYQYGMIKGLKKLNINPITITCDTNSFLNANLITSKFFNDFYYKKENIQKNIIKQKLKYLNFISNDYYINLNIGEDIISQTKIKKIEYYEFINRYFLKNFIEDKQFCLIDINLNGEKYLIKNKKNLNSYDTNYLINKGYLDILNFFKCIQGEEFYFKDSNLEKYCKLKKKEFKNKLIDFLAIDETCRLKYNNIPYIHNIIENKSKFEQLISDTAQMYRLDNSKLYNLKLLKKELFKEIKKLNKIYTDSNILLKFNNLDDCEICSIIFKMISTKDPLLIKIARKYPIHFIAALLIDTL